MSSVSVGERCVGTGEVESTVAGEPVELLSTEGCAPDVPCEDASASEKAEPSPQEVIEEVSKELRSAGIGSIVCAFINAAIVSYQSANLRPGESFVVPPEVIYALCGWLLLEGVLVLCVPRPGMLVMDGLTVFFIGLLNLVGGTPFLGVLQIWFAVKTMKRYGVYVEALQRVTATPTTGVQQ